MEISDGSVNKFGERRIGVVGDEVVFIREMIFNNRITIGDVDDEMGYSHGWCYDKGIAAYAALAVWDPETQDEPPDYKKRATPGHRRAPRTRDASNA